VQYALLALVAFFASAFSTLAGFGAGIILIGVASLFMDVKEIIPLSTGYFLALSASQVVTFRRSADWQTIKLYCLGALPGILVGMALFYVLDSTTVKQVMAVLVLGYCANGLLGLVPERRPGSAATAALSFVAGIVDAITASGGVIQAPTWLARGLRKEAFVASFAMTSVLLNPIKLGIYHAMGFLEMGNLPLLGILAVSGILGVQLGRLGLRYISPESFRRLALGFLALVALRMLVW
jgi:hypothetical protein